MNINIDTLIEVSGKLNERIEALKQFNKDEADFGEFMQHHIVDTADIIPVNSVAQFVLVDGTLALQGLMLMQQHLHNWKKAIDDKIIELKNQEFPSSIE